MEKSTTPLVFEDKVMVRESARSGACARQRINLYLENRTTCHLELCFTIIVEV